MQNQGWLTEQYRELAQICIDKLMAYIDRSQNDQQAANIPDMATWLRQNKINQTISHGGFDNKQLAQFLESYLNHSTRFHNPRYMSHQVAVPDMPSALADLIHGVINNPMAIYEMGPSAAAIEWALINWMLQKIGWEAEPPPGEVKESHGSGVFTHGGSLANFTALLAARAAIQPNAWQEGNPQDLVILAPKNAHYSISRAVGMMGLGQNAIVPIEVDEREVLIPKALGQAIGQQKLQHKRIMAVVANACATSTGLYDPLDQIADICQEHDVWFHVDGAHGASALLTENYKHLLNGISRADSTVWDAHKMLRTSAMCTAVLFRDAKHHQNTFQQQASYLFYGEGTQGVDLIQRTVECTKSAMATKLFFNLAFHGEKGLAQYVEQRYSTTHQIWRFLKNQPDVDCPYEPQSNILCFRMGEGDACQIKLKEGLLADGKFHLSSTTVNGVRYLRMSIMNPQTNLATIKSLIQEIRQRLADPT